VRVRPMRRSLLDAKWAGFTTDGRETLHIEQERDANSRVLVARLVGAGPSRGSPVAETAVNLAEFLRPRQRSFIEHCAGIQVGAQFVHLSRPVRTHRWAVWLDRVDTHVHRWVASPVAGEQSGFDALEVSRRSSQLEADFLLPAVSAGLRRRGLEPQDTIGPLEERVGVYLGEADNWDSALWSGQTPGRRSPREVISGAAKRSALPPRIGTCTVKALQGCNCQQGYHWQLPRGSR